MQNVCYICEDSVIPVQWERGTIIDCQTCGKYEPAEYFLQKMYENGLRDRHLLSGALRENYEKGVIFKLENTTDLLDSVSVPKNPLEAVDRLLFYVARKSGESSGTVTIDCSKDYSLAYAKDVIEFQYFINLARELDYLVKLGSLTNCRIAAEGWKRVNEISKNSKNSNQAFVAMWFNPELNDAWKNGLKPALEDTGYTAMRVDLSEHNEKIDDRIIAEIRKSGLLVADFTGQRGGVYFEAGFAMGLGISVIWTCRDTDIDKLHFDTRQYNHIVWSGAEDLRIKLTNRIEATLPNRPKPLTRRVKKG